MKRSISKVEAVPLHKPREFWILLDHNNKARGLFSGDDPKIINTVHVREVVEISEAELKEAGSGYAHEDTFEAGARWAIAKLRGGE